MSQELPNKKSNRKRNFLFTFKPNRSPIVYVFLCRQKSHVLSTPFKESKMGFYVNLIMILLKS